MKIIEEAGHPIYTGVVPLSKGYLIDEGKSEHFTKDYHNEKMLIRLIYDSNMLTYFIALWKHVPQTRKMASPAEPKAQSAKAAGGDPVRSSDDAGRDSAGGRKRAAGDRGEVETLAPHIEAGKKRRCA